MTKEGLEKRRKIVKRVAIGLPIAGFVAPLIISLKYNDPKSGALVGAFGFIIGGILSAGLIMVALPNAEEQKKIRNSTN